MFNKIGIITKINHEPSAKTAQNIDKFLQKQGIAVLYDIEEIQKNAELLIAVGGDGTILKTARIFVDSNIPILGVNLGRLGFLADLVADKYIDMITEILQGKYIKESRLMLSCQVEREKNILYKHLAFNDAVLHRNHIPKMLSFDLYVNGDLINNQRSDGIIVSTPTGSTAYSLSSGGPIVHPSLDVITLVSISPHTMSNRPIAIKAQSDILIHIIEHYDRAVISFDGQVPAVENTGDKIRIKQHRNKVHLIHPKNYNYFKIISSKLHWGIKSS